MKRNIFILLSCILLLCLCACGGNVKDVEIRQVESSVYSEEDIALAIDAVTDYFKGGFPGCTLTELAYAGDDMQDFAYSASKYVADEVVVLTSSFDVDSSGGDGSLHPNSTYTDWKWIMVRDTGGAWQHADHGY